MKRHTKAMKTSKRMLSTLRQHRDTVILQPTILTSSVANNNFVLAEVNRRLVDGSAAMQIF